MRFCCSILCLLFCITASHSAQSQTTTSQTPSLFQQQAQIAVSGGSNFAPKFVTSLSRLLTPLKCWRSRPEEPFPDWSPFWSLEDAEGAFETPALAAAAWDIACNRRTPRSGSAATLAAEVIARETWDAVPRSVTG